MKRTIKHYSYGYKIIKRTNKLIQFTCDNEIYYGNLKLITYGTSKNKRYYWCTHWITSSGKYDKISYQDMTYLSSSDITKKKTITPEEWKKLVFMAKTGIT